MSGLLEPKLVKGPDIFCEVVKKINEICDIHIFLTGPARGYVKKKLAEFGIPYTHLYIQNYFDMVDCYNVLDLYIVTSRIEGGPLALLECMATKVPIITTNVGMVPYLIENGVNGFISNIEDIDQLSNYAVEIIKNKELRKFLAENGFKTVQKYTWENIVTDYYNRIYRRLLNQM